MDDDFKKKLKERLDNGDITEELYEEIMDRWGSANTDKKKENTNYETHPEDPEKEEDSQKTKRIKVSGVGQFEDVYAMEFEVSGAADVSGIVNVECMEISGVARIHGNVNASESVEISGSLAAMENVSSKNLEVSGAAKISGNVDLEHLEVDGAATVEGNVKVSADIEISGRLNAESVESNRINSSGRMDVKKKIRADDISIDGIIESETVECNSLRITLRSSGGKIGSLICNTVNVSREWRRFRSATISIDKITCKKAELEGVRASVVKGDEIFLGDGCYVDYVEAKTLKLSENATVKKKNVKG